MRSERFGPRGPKYRVLARRKVQFRAWRTEISVGGRSPYGEAEAEADADGDAEGATEADGSTELEAGSEGNGMGVGSGKRRDGMPKTDSTRTSTKMPMTLRIQGRASRSLRVGS